MTQFLWKIELLIMAEGTTTTASWRLAREQQSRHISVQGDSMLVAILTSMTLSALVLMLAFPQTPTGKWLHRILVEAPARFLRDFNWAKLGSVLISLAVVMFLVSAGPEGIALLTAAGVDAAMLEVILAVWLVSMSSGLGAVWRTVAHITAKSAQLVRAALMPRNRSREPCRRKHRLQRKNDEEDEPSWAVA